MLNHNNVLIHPITNDDDQILPNFKNNYHLFHPKNYYYYYLLTRLKFYHQR
jgi:hypothetical protein